MPEQGPTREEIGRAEEAWYNTRKGTAYGGNLTEAARNALIAAEPLTRARHVREAVEALSDERAVSIARFIANHQPRPRGVAEAAALMRAALLDALGGTTPPLDETGGKA